MPMPFEELRRRALRGAAAAAGLSALSCSQPASTSGGSVDAANDADAQSRASGADATSDAAETAGAVDSADSADSADVASSADVADSASGADAAGDASAADVVDAQSGDVNADADAACKDFEPEIPACLDMSAPGWGECCQERATLCGQKYPQDSQAAQICTYGDNFSGKCSGCIPWGPPAPPAFDIAWRPHVVANGEVFVVV